MHFLHFFTGKNPAGELRQIAVVKELGQEFLVTCEQGIGRFEQLMKELLCRLMRDTDMEACFDIAANDFRYLDGEFPCGFKRHERAGFFQPVQGDFIRQLGRSAYVPIPTPSSIAEDSESSSTGEPQKPKLR